MLAVLISERTQAVLQVGVDPVLFTRFYEEALPRVYGFFLCRCGGSATVAEDLTQETFLAAISELRKGQTVERPLAWVHGIARHKLVDYYRRTVRSERVIATDEYATDDLPFPARSESRERALEALAGLPVAQRAVLLLRHMDGYSVPEIAAILDRSVEAVESLLSRGRRGFRRAYVEESDETY